MTATNTFGPNGLVSRNASGTATFNAYDLQGNTVHQYTPSEGGATVTNFAYDAYGNLVSGTAGGPYDGFGAQYGNYQDSAANGWYLMGHRWYGPGQLHFFSRDPIGYAGGTNLYGYASNDPMNSADPSGFSSINDDPEHGSINGSWGGFWINSGQQGVDDMKPEFAPGSPQRREITGFVHSILPPIGLYDAITGCDPVAGTPDSGFQRVMNGLGALPIPEIDGLGGAFDGAEEAEEACANGCFVAGTPVQMADGTTKPIEQVKAGDLVKSRNPQTGKTEAKKVLDAFQLHDNQELDLHLSDGEIITCTAVHPIYVEGKGFTLAGQLAVGDAIATQTGQSVTLNKIEWLPEATKIGLIGGYTVYNMTVADDHTYFVGKTNGGIWVHNATLCPRLSVQRLAHILNRHRPGTAFGKSWFNPNESISDLLRAAGNTPGILQRNGNFATIIDAGRNIGFDRSTGAQTSIYTVITDANNNVVTMFPGRPGR